MTSSFRYGAVEIVYLKHACFMLKGSKVVYIDPYELQGQLDKADVVLATHDHFDHLDMKSLKIISKPETVLVIPKGCFVEGYKVCELAVGEEMDLGGVKVKAVPAYNVGKPFHKRGECVGYIVELDGVRVYHAGDTDRIPEMKKIEVDIALLPIGGTYTMDVKEAAEAAKDIKAKYYIPMHFGIPGTRADPKEFAKLVENAVVLEPLL
ncbi:MAG: MBL fold metallo-hydrolase [Archaeoglobaceae archaeon]